MAFGLIATLFLARSCGLVFEGPSVQIGQLNLQLDLRLTGLGWFMATVVAAMGLLVVLYSLGGLVHLARPMEYYGAILIASGGAIGVFLSGDLFELLVFWEIVTFCLYLLIASGGGQSGLAATKAFVMTGIGDGALLLAASLMWAAAGGTSIHQIDMVGRSGLTVVSFLLVALAATTKAGALPLHTWLPTCAQHSDASAMAFLPAAVDKLLGIYLLVLLVKWILPLEPGSLQLVLVGLGAATIIVAVMVALVQHDLKRLLAFHAVSQVGYMIVGIATLTSVGLVGGVFHMLNNVLYKSCLFLCAGAVERQAGTCQLSQLGGLGRRMPLTFVACLMAALAISGVPPFNGFASKWMIYQGLIQMGSTQTGLAAVLWPVWFVAAIFGSALTLASFVKVLHSVFLSRQPDQLRNLAISDPPASQTVVVLILAFLCLGFGIFYPTVTALIGQSLGISSTTAILIGRWDSLLGTGLLVLGLAIGLLILSAGMLSSRLRLVHTWTCGEPMPNDHMVVPGTGFYKTISSMPILRDLYLGQERGYFDLYKIGQTICGGVTGLLRFAHNGVLPFYITWIVLGLLLILVSLSPVW